MKPHAISLRALNDYRRASPFTYLGLRNLLESSACRGDRWAQEIATEVVFRHARSNHLHSRLFKELSKEGLEFREVGYPSPNEALAEAALLAACAEAGGPFSPHEDVFSYHLNPSDSSTGSFKAYFPLFGARHRAIGKACQLWPESIVLYADIRKFYPKVRQTVSLKAWVNACDQAKLNGMWRELGTQFLVNQKSFRKGLLVGPQFSHLIAHLVLQDFDRAMRQKFRHRYFRYVDDVALVIPVARKQEALKFVKDTLAKVGLQLNPEKDFEIPAEQWRKDAPHQVASYHEEDSTSDHWWMQFIDQVKCFLMANPGSHAGLVKACRDEDIRMPLPRYQADVQDAEYQERFARRVASKRFLKRVARLSAHALISEAKEGRAAYYREFNETWGEFEKATDLKRKWLGSRLKYLTSRLTLLASLEQLTVVSDRLAAHNEFAEHHAVIKAVSTRDASDVLRFGSRACAATGQALATAGMSVRCNPRKWSDEAIAGYATMLLMGARLGDIGSPRALRDLRTRYVMGEFGSDSWTKSKSPFFAELFALTGKSSLEKQRRIFISPLDPDESWVLFADQLHQPGS